MDFLKTGRMNMIGNVKIQGYVNRHIIGFICFDYFMSAT